MDKVADTHAPRRPTSLGALHLAHTERRQAANPFEFLLWSTLSSRATYCVTRAAMRTL